MTVNLRIITGIRIYTFMKRCGRFGFYLLAFKVLHDKLRIVLIAFSGFRLIVSIQI